MSTSSIPPELLTRMLQEFSDDKKTRISSAALSALTEYFSTFIREAIWRSAEMRRNELKKGGSEATTAGGTVFLEVEDLEKAAPQLLLDF
ncbi:centromere protein X [Pyronema omphalodes]|nr:centromere protein X [Pyronema omphalodes]